MTDTKNYIIDASQTPNGAKIKRDVSIMSNNDLLPQGVLVNLPNGDTLIITRNFVELYAEIFKMYKKL